MIVLCVGMYRSCSTWQYGVASLILERHRNGRRLGFVDGTQFVQRNVADGASTGWQVMKAHDAAPCFDEILHRGEALGIFAYRDIRDVVLSWMHMTGTAFEEICSPSGFLALCLSNDRFWRSRPGVLVQTYEAIVAEPVQSVIEIAHHVGGPINETDAQAIADEMSRDANRRRIEKMNEKLRSEGAELVPQDLSLFDPNSLLHWNHIRDGRTGAWREAFSAEQCQVLAQQCGDWLIDRGYEPDRSWAGEPVPVSTTQNEDQPRLSYARDAEDILLDRVFQGKVDSYLEVNPTEPINENRSYFFYRRGLRGMNILTSPELLEKFRAERPDDFNLAITLTDRPGMDSTREPIPAQSAVRSMSDLIQQYLMSPPDLVAFNTGTDAASVLRGMPLDHWQPRLFILEDRNSSGTASGVGEAEAILLSHGYHSFSNGIRIYLARSDQKSMLGQLQIPVNDQDNYELAELVELRTECERLSTLVEAERAATKSMFTAICRQMDDAVGGLSGERDIARNEAAQHNYELERIKAELRSLNELRVAETSAFETERELFARQSADAAAAIDGLVSERDDLRTDCAVWEAEASRQSRMVYEGRAALARAQAEHANQRVDQDTIEAVRTRFAMERSDYQAEREAWQRERSNLESQRDEAVARAQQGVLKSLLRATRGPKQTTQV